MVRPDPKTGPEWRGPLLVCATALPVLVTGSAWGLVAAVESECTWWR